MRLWSDINPLALSLTHILGKILTRLVINGWSTENRSSLGRPYTATARNRKRLSSRSTAHKRRPMSSRGLVRDFTLAQAW
jgi:hypothetical protein